MAMYSDDTFDGWLAEQLEEDAFRAEYEALRPGFEVARLRIQRGLTQAELARRAGTRQSSISRLESGGSEPSLSFLRRVVQALGGRVEVRVLPCEDAASVPTTPAARRQPARSSIVAEEPAAYPTHDTVDHVGRRSDVIAKE